MYQLTKYNIKTFFSCFNFNLQINLSYQQKKKSI